MTLSRLTVALLTMCAAAALGISGALACIAIHRREAMFASVFGGTAATALVALTLVLEQLT